MGMQQLLENQDGFWKTHHQCSLGGDFLPTRDASAEILIWGGGRMASVDFQAGALAIKKFEQNELAMKLSLPGTNVAMQAVAYPLAIHREPRSMDLSYPIVSQPSGSSRPSRYTEPEIYKIAVLRSNGIGDFIFALPALEALKAAYPMAEIVYLGLEWHAEFLTGRPGPVDRVVVVPASRGISLHEDADEAENSSELNDFFERMAGEHFDLALQIHGGGRYSNSFVRRLSARITAGLRSPDAIPLDRWVPYNYFQPEVLRYLEVVALVGAHPVSLEAEIQVTEQDRVEADQLVPLTSQPLAVIHPGAGDPRRRWPVEKFAAVGDALAWAGAQVVVIGTGDEQELADGVVDLMSAEAQNICGQISLNGLAGLLSRADVVVSNDSGPLHLAAAVGAATVGIYWCGNLITAGPITRTRHRPALSWQINCPVCGTNCTRAACDHQVSFVADISQEEITASALEMMEFSQRHAGEGFRVRL